MSSRQFNRKDNWFFYINQINSNNPDETILIRDNLEISGNTTLRNVSISGNIIPTEDSKYDIGSATNKIRDLYLSNSTLFMGNEANDAVYNVLSVVNDVPTFKGVIELPDISNAATISSTLNILTVSGDASFNKSVNISGGLTIGNLNNNYVMPSSLGTANQVLSVPSSGNVLEFVDGGWVETATSGLDMATFDISNVGGVYTSDISATDISTVNLTINSAYKMPTTIGSANQVLTVPVSGNVLTFADNTTGWIGTATSDLNMTNYNITGISQLQGASIITIDPSGIGDNTGLVIIKGDLQVDGTTTTINSSILDISDHRILLSSSATNDAETDGAGIEISNNKLFTYSSSDNAWNSNINMIAPKFTGDISATNLTVNSAYKMPTTIGTANQILTVPASGNVLEFADNNTGWIGTATSGLDMSGFDISNIDNLYATTGYNTYQTLGTKKIVNPPSNTLTLGGVNIGALNKRTRTSYASAETCVSTWTARTTLNNNSWRSVCWAAELGIFCAVSFTGTNNFVITSPDGITWTTRTTNNNKYGAICWCAELSIFVAVAYTGSNNRVMTSPDGLTWTTRGTNNNEWTSVCWSPELSLFCAVALTGTNIGNISDRVMTSPDGLTWTTRTTNYNAWASVCWSSELSIFCAVSRGGTNNCVMTSPNGITWTTRGTNNNSWETVCWSPELSLFCAVSTTGTNDRVMTSPDGITWTTRETNTNIWRSVCWAAELSLFCAVSETGTNDQIMTSSDGIYWTTRTNSVNRNWLYICWSPELSIFCAVGLNNTMTSAIGMPNSKNVVYKDTKNIRLGEKSIASGVSSIAIGDNCSATGLTSVSIGIDNYSQGTNSISIGNNNRSMNENVITIGNNCGVIGGAAAHTISIGERAGIGLGQYSIAIGKKAAEGAGNQTNCIVLNAQTDTALNPAGSSRFYVKPVRNASYTNALYYDTTSGEISYDLSGGGGGGGTTLTGTALKSNHANSPAANTDNGIILGNAIQSGSQGFASIAIGVEAANNGQAGWNVAVGARCGGSQQVYAIAVGHDAGKYGQGSDSIAIGRESGTHGTMATKSICIGYKSGNWSTGDSSVSIGYTANARELNAIAIGSDANAKANAVSIGTQSCLDILGGGTEAVAIGYKSGRDRIRTQAIAIGSSASEIDALARSISIGYQAGFRNLRNNSIAIGAFAGYLDTCANSIILNASDISLNASDHSGLYVKPVRNDATPTNVLFYNTTSGEISYGDEGQVSSDIRLKHNIIRVDSGLNIINKLEIKKFNKCSNFNPTESEILEAKLYVGVIAQDVLKVEPELVSGGDYLDNSGNLIETPYFVKNNNLLMYNVKATQELSDKLTDIENKLYFANNKIQQLEGQNSVLKNAINSLLKKNNMRII